MIVEHLVEWRMKIALDLIPLKKQKKTRTPKQGLDMKRGKK